MDKRIIGLDLGTNSIGWSSVISKRTEEGKEQITEIEGAGSRIIPMDAAAMGDFEKGKPSVSSASTRTSYRTIRRMYERRHLRRERLHRVLEILNFLPAHYARSLTRYGKFKDDVECKVAWCKAESGQYEFLFKDAFQEMLADFLRQNPELGEKNQKIPYDWTIYYLRKKALSQPISKQELAWILLNFNQKRGYHQLRGEEEETPADKLVEYYALRVVSVEATVEKSGKKTRYKVHLENGMIHTFDASSEPDWVGKVKEFIVTTKLDEKGNPEMDKEGNIERKFRAPNDKDWTLCMERTKDEIKKSGKTVGEFIYDALLADPKQKIRGGLVRTIERSFYKEELRAILKSQERYIPELSSRELYLQCINELYPSNEAYRNYISSRDICYLLVDDILFYQRPLKSKKSLIAGCPYESHNYASKDTGEIKQAAVKCIAKSNPIFQEFRLWQFVQNIRFFAREKMINGRLCFDVDVTDELMPTFDARVRLFDFLNDRKEIAQDTLMKDFFKLKAGKDKLYAYKWNYAEEGKKYPCNETRAQMLSLLKKAGVEASFLTKDITYKLWHIMYSVENKDEYGKAIRKFAEKNGLPESFVAVFQKASVFQKDYGSYSEKAIKKLLKVMYMGKYWSEEAIDDETKERIASFMQGAFDESVPARVRNYFQGLHELSDYQGLPLWAACYVVYGRHSEAKDITHWDKPEDIDHYLINFKQHSLRNPVVEQVLLETMRVVRDIWKTYGRIDEVHVELGREMKNPADKRQQMFKKNQDNENTNLRIKTLLTEFMNPEFGIEGVRPFSPSQQDLLRIYEEGAWDSEEKPDEEIADIYNRLTSSNPAKRPSRSEIMKYKLWLEQHYLSPYTGKPIPLAKLFTPAYQIEHIIPQSRFFDDSFANKVICEAEVNQYKNRMLGYEFIQAHGGETISSNLGGEIRILTVEEYEQLVNHNYRNRKAKRDRLLMNDIPDDFIERQMNDSRYISKLVKTVLSNLVREEGEQEAISKNVITCNGAITDRLKNDWGLNDVWNHIILPRFQRMNELTGTNVFTAISSNGHEIPSMPFALQRGFKKKRIDHRHHALDAIVIACTTRNHVNLLNNESAMSANKDKRHDLSRLLRRYEETTVMRNGAPQKIKVAKEFFKPWDTFTTDVERILRSIVVSFKQNLRVINKTNNKYQKIVDGERKLVKQEKGQNRAVRKQMHKETFYGKVNLIMEKTVPLKRAVDNPNRIIDPELRHKIKQLLAQGCDEKGIEKYFKENKEIWPEVNTKKIRVYCFSEEEGVHYFASRKALDSSVKIESITDSGIRTILQRHLEECGGKAELAFSPDGIDKMNANIFRLNGNKPHQPIYKVRVFEQASKFAVGEKGNKATKFVEAAKGTNLFLAVYEEERIAKSTGTIERKRIYKLLPLRASIERRRKGMPIADPVDEEGRKLQFVLSPKSLVYVPTPQERESGKLTFPLDRKRIYAMIDASEGQVNFLPYNVSSLIFAVQKAQAKDFCKRADNAIVQNEFGVGSPKSKNERAVTGEMIKEICIPIKVDRLGHITEVNGEKVYD